MVIEHALRNMIRNPAKTGLNMVGIALGAMLVTIIFAMTGDMSGVMASPFQRLYGGELLVLPQGTSFGRLPSQYLGLKYDDNGAGQSLNLSDLSAVGIGLSNAKELFIINESFDDQGMRVPVVSQDFRFGNQELRIVRGRGFEAKDQGELVVLLNQDARQIYPVGSEINLFLPILHIEENGFTRFDFSQEKPITFTVIGHYQSPIPTPFISNSPPTQGPLVLMPLATFRTVAKVPVGWTQAAVMPEGNREITAQIKESLPSFVVMGSEEMAMALLTGARVRSEEENVMKAISSGFMWAIFLVSSCIVALTLLVALRLRRKEFAILRAQGWKRSHLLQTLVVECFLLGLVSGLLGYLLSCLLLMAIVSKLGGSFSDLAGISLLNGIVISLVFAVLSVGGSLLPVRQSTRLRPAEVIRGA